MIDLITFDRNIPRMIHYHLFLFNFYQLYDLIFFFKLLMKCIGQKPIRTVLTVKVAGKCRYMYMNVFLKTF